MPGKKNIIVTGATGTIGSTLVDALLTLNHNVIVIVRNLEKSTQLFSDRVTHVVFDGTDFTQNLTQYNADIVIHLASLSTSQDDKKNIINLIDSNIGFVSLLLDALKHSPLKLFVNAGSFSEFHTNDGTIDPTYFYSATKTASRFIIDYFSKVNDFIFVNAILYSVYGKQGEHKKIFDIMIDAMGSQEPVPMSEGRQILDFIHIDDVIRFYLLLIENYDILPDRYNEYHIGTGKGTSIRELAQICHKQCHVPPNIVWGAIQSRKRDTVFATADTRKVFKDINWKADIFLETGIEKYLVKYGNQHV
jgi:nucleoside-diphosphate-sugar epimerase